MMRRLGRLRADERGNTVIEFAIVAPVLLLLILGTLELGHTMYTTTVLQGQLQKAARDMTLEDASSAARRTAIENGVRDRIHDLMSTATVTFNQTAYHDYRNANDPGEEFVDGNSNGACDNGESFVDYNGNGTRDANGGVTGRGGAKDVVLFTATAVYPRLALGRMFFADDNITLSSRSLLRNQPSDDQADPPVRSCPA